MTHDEFLARLNLEYPVTAKQFNLRELVIPTLIAPTVMRLPRALWNEAERLVSLFWRLRLNADYAKEKSGLAPAVRDPGHASVLMSYDFHVDFAQGPEGQLRLIEINTNASMSLLTDIMNCTNKIQHCTRAEFLKDFAVELGRPLSGARIAIVDDKPTQQKLYVEFLLYKELFEANGARAIIVDRAELSMREGKLWAGEFGPIDLVYNRCTDFYFDEEPSRGLREAFAAGCAVVTPGPYDYRLLADKARMVDWSRDGALEAYGFSREECATLRRGLIRTRDVASLDPEILWNERKHLIFKPENAYGGKAVFRGSSISRGPFQAIVSPKNPSQKFLAQDFVPAPTTTSNGEEFKYDLRFFTYRDRIHTACARLYQGQMTNGTTPGGGVAAIAWS